MMKSSSLSPSPWSLVTPFLVFSCFCLLTGDLLFGFDTASFGGILANPVRIDAHSPPDFHYSVFAGLNHQSLFLGSIAFIHSRKPLPPRASPSRPAKDTISLG